MGKHFNGSFGAVIKTISGDAAVQLLSPVVFHSRVLDIDAVPIVRRQDIMDIAVGNRHLLRCPLLASPGCRYIDPASY
ncbi:hypothetical protein D3C76_1231060 [compost metagenome]